MKKEVIGNCELYCGDCREVIPEIDRTFDFVCIDPPYKFEAHDRGFSGKRDYFKKISDYGTHESFKLNDDFVDLLISKSNEVNFFSFCNDRQKFDFQKYAESRGYSYKELPLEKNNPSPLCNNQWLPNEWAIHIFKNCSVKGSYHTKQPYFICNNFKNSNIKHPTPKPLNIMNRIILNCSNPGDLVCDCFMGSGSTGVSCVRNGRHFIGVENNIEHFSESCFRIEQAYTEVDLFANENEAEQLNLLGA